MNSTVSHQSFFLIQDSNQDVTLHFSHHVCLLSFNLWQLLRLSFRTFIVLKTTGQLFHGMIVNLSLSHVFSWRLSLCSFGKKSIKGKTYPSQCILSGYTWCWYVLQLVIFTLLGLRWCLPCFAYTVTTFPFIKSCGEAFCDFKNTLSSKLCYFFVSIDGSCMQLTITVLFA